MTQIYINESCAISILRSNGLTENQVKTILLRSPKQTYDGQNMYPVTYISEQAKDN